MLFVSFRFVLDSIRLEVLRFVSPSLLERREARGGGERQGEEDMQRACLFFFRFFCLSFSEGKGGGRREEGDRGLLVVKEKKSALGEVRTRGRSEGEKGSLEGFLVEGDGLDRGIEGEEVLDVREGDLFERAGPDRRTGEGLDLQHRSNASVKILALLLIIIIHHHHSSKTIGRKKGEKREATKEMMKR